MIYSRHILAQILFLFVMTSTGELLNDFSSDNVTEINTFVTNESISISSSVSNTYSSSSLILTALLTNGTSSNDTISDESTSSPTAVTSRGKGSMISLVDQINTYRNTRILTRIAQCDSNMRLNDICETYSIDNDTNLLIHQSDIGFLTFEDLFDSFFNRSIVENFNQSCLSTNWCRNNLSENDIQLTSNNIQQQGHSFCSLEQCHSRLELFIDSCPILSNTNISIPTLKLSPMLCTLYNEQRSWNSTECIEEIVHLLHISYAVWPQFERCYDDHSAGLLGCTAECQTLNDMLSELKQQCNGNTSFLSQVPALAWYQSIDLKEICYEKIRPKRPTFIHSVQAFFSFDGLQHQFYKQPAYTASFAVLLISLALSFSLCFFMKSKYCMKSNHYRRFNNDYEYTRLHHSSFELGDSTEIPHCDSTTNGLIDEESTPDLNDRGRPSECQRLLFVNS